jgi:hypothetical protein
MHSDNIIKSFGFLRLGGKYLWLPACPPDSALQKGGVVRVALSRIYFPDEELKEDSMVCQGQICLEARNIMHISSFRKAAIRYASASKMLRYF